MSQLTLSSVPYLTKKKTTRREKFLTEMEAVVPWERLKDLIRPVYPEAGNGRRPMDLERMLRIHFMQQWFNLSDPGMEDALYDSESMRRFAKIELGEQAIPDETTILNFRHLLEEYKLSDGIFNEVRSYLEEKGMILREGTIVDATIINAPSSTKNAEKKRDPEMKQTKKGNQWYFGMKAHIGTDTRRGLVHSIVCTSANVHDSQEFEELLHGDEESVYGDQAYANREKCEAFEKQGITWNVCRKASRGKTLSMRDKLWNRTRSRVRAFGEHAFGVVKHLWGHRKIRYRGIDKNAAQLFTLFALANLYLVRRELSSQST